MRERFSAIVAFIMLVLVVLASWWAADYAQHSIVLDKPTPVTHHPDAWSGPFVMLLSNEQGRVAQRLIGRKMTHYPDTDVWVIDQVTSTSQRPEQPVIVTKADKATVYNIAPKNKLIVMQGHAHLKRLPYENLPNLEVYSEKLNIHTDQDLFETDEKATVIQGKTQIVGKGMRYNNRTRELQVSNQTNVKIDNQQAPKAGSNR